MHAQNEDKIYGMKDSFYEDSVLDQFPKYMKNC